MNKFITNKNQEYLGFFTTNAFAIYYLSLIRKLERTSGKYFKKFSDINNAAKEIDLNSRHLKAFLKNGLPINHTTSYIIALELYYYYKKDKEKAIYLLTEIINNNYYNYQNLNRLLNSNDVYLNEHSKEYSDSLIKELKNGI